ncbi:MAG TPA: PTS sugar transporter subunit IIA [Candidatus Krumholzibacteria bacterium]|nr:PTS sugar transporter subunit IIA [Candidatus Krumholzibacteria bacterium]
MQGIAFGPTIRLLRQAKGISLRELARQLGVSPAFLSQIEAGRQHKIPRARIVQVAEMLGVEEGYLLSTARQMHPELLKFMSETPEAAEFMIAAMRGGLEAEDFTQLREIIADKKRRVTILKSAPAPKKKTGTSEGLEAFLEVSMCQTGMQVQNKERLLQRLAKDASQKVREVSADDVLRHLERREEQAPTSIGGGVGIPHAFVAGVDKPVVGAYILQRPIPFGPTDADKVRTVFFLLGRQGQNDHHLPILARIARLCATPEFLATIGKAKTGRDLHKTIVSWDNRISS